MPSSAPAAAPAAPAAPAAAPPATLASVEPSAAFAYAKYYEFFRKLPAWAEVDENSDPSLTQRALLVTNAAKVVDGLKLMLIALDQEIRYMEPAGDEHKQMQAANVRSMNRWIAAGCQMNGEMSIYYQEDDASFTEAVRFAMQQLGQSTGAQHITYDKKLYERFRKCFSRETWPSTKAKKKHFTKIFAGYKELLTSLQFFLDFQGGAGGAGGAPEA
jgi:hypothetical protein